MGKSSRRKGKAKSSSQASTSSATREPAFCAGWIWWSAWPGAPRKPPKDDFDKRIPADIRKEFFNLMGRYRDQPEKLKYGLHFENIGDDVWELKIKRHGNPYRLLFYRWGSRAIVLDVFHKTTQKTPKARALERKAKWLQTRPSAPPD